MTQQLVNVNGELDTEVLVGKLKETVFVVEATIFEHMCLWNEWRKRITWQDEPMGANIVLSYTDGYPSSIQIKWSIVNGKRVMFWEGAGWIIDYKEIRKWLDGNCDPLLEDRQGHARCDAMNFHLCVERVMSYA